MSTVTGHTVRTNGENGIGDAKARPPNWAQGKGERLGKGTQKGMAGKGAWVGRCVVEGAG